MPLGAGWAAETAYLTSHSVKAPRGMLTGIVVESAAATWTSANLYGGAWTGVVVIAGGRSEDLTSDPGDNGMATYVRPGDLIEFTAANLPVDAPGDDIITGVPARLLVQAAVAVP